MANHIKRGESLLIPFCDGLSISDSQMKPRMYKTRQNFEKAFPKHYLGTDGVELVEYAEVRHGRWIENITYDEDGYFDSEYKCSKCGRTAWYKEPYCHCGAKMDEEV